MPIWTACGWPARRAGRRRWRPGAPSRAWPAGAATSTAGPMAGALRADAAPLRRAAVQAAVNLGWVQQAAPALHDPDAAVRAEAAFGLVARSPYEASAVLSALIAGSLAGLAGLVGGRNRAGPAPILLGEPPSGAHALRVLRCGPQVLRWLAARRRFGPAFDVRAPVAQQRALLNQAARPETPGAL